MDQIDDLTPEAKHGDATVSPADMQQLDGEMQKLLQGDGAQAASKPTPEQQKPDPQAEAVSKTLYPWMGPDEVKAMNAGGDYTYVAPAKAIAGGLRDAGQQIINFADDTWNWVNDNLINLRSAAMQKDYEMRGGGPQKLSTLITGKKDYQHPVTLPDVPTPDTKAGELARSIISYATPFAGYLKALKFSKLGTSAKALVAGAAADATAVDPHQARLSNVILDWTDHSPVLGGAVLEFLKADPNDSAALGRLKNVIEGGIAGAVIGKTAELTADLALRSIKLFKAQALAEGKDPMALIHETAAASQAADAAAVVARPAPGVGFTEAFGTLKNGGTTADLYNKAFAALKAGKDTISGVRDPILVKSRAAFDAGHIASPDDLRAYVESGYSKVGQPAAQDAAHSVDQASNSLDFTSPAPVQSGTAAAPAPSTISTDLAWSMKDKNRAVDPSSTDLVALTQDVAQNGVQKPITVTVGPEDHAYVTDGNNRIAAAKASGIQDVPVQFVRQEAPFTPEQMAKAQPLDKLGINPDQIVAPPMSAEHAAAKDELRKLLGEHQLLTPEEKVFASDAIKPEYAAVAPRELPPGPKPLPRIQGAKVTEMVDAIKQGRMSDLAATLEKSDFNLANFDTEGDVKDLVNGFSKVFEKQADAAKMGVQSFANIKELADDLGAGVNTLKQLYGDTDKLGARVLSHRILLVASAEKIHSLTPAAIAGDAMAQLALRKHVALHAAMQAEMKGVQTEVARALAQFRISAKGVDLQLSERNALIEAMGGAQLNKDFAEKLAALNGKQRLINRFIQKGALARNSDALFEAWVNGVLSSPITHAVNMVGNGLVAIGSVAERFNAAMIGRVFRNGGEQIALGEVKAYAYGMVEGLSDAARINVDGWRTLKDAAATWKQGDVEGARRMIADSPDMGNAWKTFATDTPVIDNAAFGTRQYELQSPAITADNLPALTNLIGRKSTEYIGLALRTPGRALATNDELFKTAFYRGELKAQAYRKSLSEGLSGEPLIQRISDLIENPTPEMSGAAIKAMREGTFSSPLGKVGTAVQKVVSAVPGMRYLMPFVRTPTNIMKYTFDRTPVLSQISATNRAMWEAGGIQRDMLLSRWATGAALYSIGAYLTAQGFIVGGGMEKQRGAENLGNIPAYSVKWGDKYYQFNRLDPVGMFLGLAADMTTISGHLEDTEADKLAVAAMLSVQKNLTSKSYLSALTDFIDSVVAPGATPATAQRWMDRMAGSFVPFSGLSTTVRKEFDPQAKEVWGIMDATMARIPGLSKLVPPHRDLFGNPVLYEGGLGPDIASPIAMRTASDHPGAQEIARLNIDLRHPMRQISSGDGSPPIDLNAKQYDRLMVILGKEAGGMGFDKALRNLVESPQYKQLHDDPVQNKYSQGKEIMIRALYDAMRQAAQMQLISEDKTLRKTLETHLQNRGLAIKGMPLREINGLDSSILKRDEPQTPMPSAASAPTTAAPARIQ